MSKFKHAARPGPDPKALEAFAAGAQDRSTAPVVATPPTPPAPVPVAMVQFNTRLADAKMRKLKAYCVNEGITLQEWLARAVDQLPG